MKLIYCPALGHTVDGCCSYVPITMPTDMYSCPCLYYNTHWHVFPFCLCPARTTHGSPRTTWTALTWSQSSCRSWRRRRRRRRRRARGKPPATPLRTPRRKGARRRRRRWGGKVGGGGRGAARSLRHKTIFSDGASRGGLRVTVCQDSLAIRCLAHRWKGSGFKRQCAVFQSNSRSESLESTRILCRWSFFLMLIIITK